MTATEFKTHGYVPYTRGCRCDVCRAAKAKYVRDKRAAAKANRGGRVVVVGISHGYAGYNEHTCRCYICRAAKAAADRRWQARLARRAGERR